MRSMKTSNSRLLPLVFLPFLIASCTRDLKPIAFGHDTCSVCEKPVNDPAIAALAVSNEGERFNYDSIECLMQHLGHEKEEMSVIKVADYQHPGFMLDALNSYYKLDNAAEDATQFMAFRHNRANTLCWKELQDQVKQRSVYFSQDTSSKADNLPNNRG